MCGIAFCLAPTSNVRSRCDSDEDELDATLVAAVQRRGPDACGRCVRLIADTWRATFFGSVLHMRGSLTQQPLEDNYGNVLLWNGEIFGGIEVGDGENDSSILLQRLQGCKSESDVTGLLSCIQGPWALVYYQASAQTLWFGRDIFGRRSLLWKLPDRAGEPLLLSSVALPIGTTAATAVGDWEEVPASLYAVPLPPPLFNERQLVRGQDLAVTCFPWALYSCGLCQENRVPDQLKLGRVVRRIASAVVSSLSFDFNTELPGSPKLPMPEGPTDERLLLASVSPAVSSNEAAAGVCDKEEPQTAAGCCDAVLDPLHAVSHVDADADRLIAVLAESVRRRVTNHADCCLACSSGGDRLRNQCPHATVAVLFSGGIDSLVLAALADRFVPKEKPIDLVNVAFQHPDAGRANRHPETKRIAKGNAPESSSVETQYAVPDRITGYAGLQALSKTRKWNFVEVNVTLDELKAARHERIAQLILPLQTVLDDSIGCALWFAARGSGIIREPSGAVLEYKSNAKVVLVGMGADEQLGGYSRHRSTFEAHGWTGLLAEIKMELGRIAVRNLGRDDRIISDHGKEARFPFLDENVVSFLCSLPLSCKMDLTLPRGVGEKLLLRRCALKLGLGAEAAMLPKRAIQFGSRIAKMEGRSEKGSDVCARVRGAPL